jgi:hypothetical protein
VDASDAATSNELRGREIARFWPSYCSERTGRTQHDTTDDRGLASRAWRAAPAPRAVTRAFTVRTTQASAQAVNPPPAGQKYDQGAARTRALDAPERPGSAIAPPGSGRHLELVPEAGFTESAPRSAAFVADGWELEF